jgi:hypothetical protein
LPSVTPGVGVLELAREVASWGDSPDIIIDVAYLLLRSCCCCCLIEMC